MADPFVGEIRLFAGQFAPNGWAFCDGSPLPIAGNEVLFSLIGTIYGGDGKNNFGLPDFRGSVVIGAGQSNGLPNYLLGQKGGSEFVTLESSQLPPHTHLVNVSSIEAISSIPNSSLSFGKVSNNLHFYTDTSQGTNGTRDFSANAIGTTPDSRQPHDNTMPSLAINYIICLSGLYPPIN